MSVRFASALFALSLPLFAQEQKPAAETMFYKAFYLEKGQHDFAGAMALYEQFLAAAPDHPLVAEAAKQQFALLGRTGKTKELAAFRDKYRQHLGKAADAPVPVAEEARGERARGEGARGEGARGEGRPDPAARMAELEKQLAAAKDDGDEAKVKELEAQLQRMKAMAERGQQGGRGRGGVLGLLNTKVADMTDEQRTQLRDGLANMDMMIDRIREARGDEAADKLSASMQSLQKALDANQLEEAQKLIDELRTNMRGGRGGRDAGGAGGEGRPGRGRAGGGGAGGGRPAGGGGGGGEAGGGGGN